MDVKIIRSPRRFRTVSARVHADTLLIQAPASLAPERLEKIVADFKVHFEKRALREKLQREQSLIDVAARLNARYFGNKLTVHSIQYVTDQNSKFGCCNFRSGDIRISHHVGFLPAWVRDYVVLHEMAHLIEPNHGKAFWAIVSRYKRTERARGYLMAFSRYGHERE